VRGRGKKCGALLFSLNFLWLLSLFQDKESDKHCFKEQIGKKMPGSRIKDRQAWHDRKLIKFAPSFHFGHLHLLLKYFDDLLSNKIFTVPPVFRNEPPKNQ